MSIAASRKPGRLAALGLAMAAGLHWAASRMTWLDVAAFDDKSGATSASLTGAAWATELTAVALLLAAGCVAGLALRRLGRRVVGIVCALAGAGIAWIPVRTLTQEIDTQRVHSLLSSSAEGGAQTATGTQTGPVTLSEWAEISSVTLHYAGPALSLVGAAIALVCGVILALRPGLDAATMNRYERKQSRQQRLRDDLQTAPDSGRVMWDALDADIDPTEDSDGSARK
ncbi:MULTISPECIES: TIGR02234 family membrane protein [unclassified Corynebacterium]|uniref:TIGR02234 family membrane protein n=1 Tax=unclassified Corynebacterium TaxID=2624378 RepID=UPI0029CA6468|nr:MULTISPECIES: TIGR02234 family membrane protein [unclassified Corynebacterium]WPF65387.1 TIGR02234 family membrane protein [Corynebacterium sp. 22KM0430]WPF67882.1 TIGR02234 family membrane protein [Corynebacterium sp. 21KM1197]